MRTYTETDVRRMLGLPDDKHLVEVEIDSDGSDFKDSVCCTDWEHPASVHVDWTRVGFDEDTDRPNSLNLEQEAFCWEHAPADLAEILEHTEPFAHDDDVYVKVVVNDWYLRYAVTETQVAA